MKTLKKLSNRKLDEMQDRIADKYWSSVDVSPRKVDEKSIKRLYKMELRIGKERLRRLGL